jgi:hypothetical protein
MRALKLRTKARRRTLLLRRLAFRAYDASNHWAAVCQNQLGAFHSPRPEPLLPTGSLRPSDCVRDRYS